MVTGSVSIVFPQSSPVSVNEALAALSFDTPVTLDSVGSDTHLLPSVQTDSQ